MCTVKLYEIMQEGDFPMAGSILYNIMKKNIDSTDKVIIDMEGVSSLPSMFLNVSIGRFIDEFGLDKLRQKVSFVKIPKLQAERLKDYINRYNFMCD